MPKIDHLTSKQKLIVDIVILSTRITLLLQVCFAINSALGVLYSCSKTESNAPLFKELKVVSYVEPFVKAVDPGDYPLSQITTVNQFHIGVFLFG